jgi:uncharacterized protein YifN (PemK superfamily)
LVTVVPISATPPNPVRAWHHKLERDPLPGGKVAEVWAKCDMISVVCFSRLTGYYKRWRGERQYKTLTISLTDIRGIRRGMLYGLGMGELVEDFGH